MFATGNDAAIIRLSETNLLTESSSGLLPSLAIKFLIDGKHSENIFGMPSFNASDSWDFFAQPMKNRVEPFSEDQTFERLTILKKLIEGSSRPFAVGNAPIALWNHDGSEISTSNADTPYELEFTSQIHFPEEKQEGVMFYDQLKTIEEGTNLLEVWAWTAPESLGGDKIKIADVKLTSPLVTSTFGDERLYF